MAIIILSLSSSLFKFVVGSVVTWAVTTFVVFVLVVFYASFTPFLQSNFGVAPLASGVVFRFLEPFDIFFVGPYNFSCLEDSMFYLLISAAYGFILP